MIRGCFQGEKWLKKQKTDFLDRFFHFSLGGPDGIRTRDM